MKKMKAGVVLLTAWMLSAAATSAGASIFVGGSYGWLKNHVYRNVPKVGSPYIGGAGKSVEAGFGIRSISLSAEIGPSYDQPVRKITSARDLGLVAHGKYQFFIGTLAYRLEPIENVQPFIILGGGQGAFTFDYGVKGHVFRIHGKDRTLKTERWKSWVAEAGVGFESPIRSWLLGGLRGRFLYNRWRPLTDEGRSPSYRSGNGFVVDATLKIRL